MSRYVIAKDSDPSKGTGDGFGTRLAKYIPAEIVAMYTITINSMVAAKPPAALSPWIAVGAIALFLLATFVYFAQRAPAGAVRRAHMIASPIAFLAWAYPLAAPLLGTWFIAWIAVLGQAVAALAAWLAAP